MKTKKATRNIQLYMQNREGRGVKTIYKGIDLTLFSKAWFFTKKILQIIFHTWKLTVSLTHLYTSLFAWMDRNYDFRFFFLFRSGYIERDKFTSRFRFLFTLCLFIKLVFSLILLLRIFTIWFRYLLKYWLHVIYFSTYIVLSFMDEGHLI